VILDASISGRIFWRERSSGSRTIPTASPWRSQPSSGAISSAETRSHGSRETSSGRSSTSSSATSRTTSSREPAGAKVIATSRSSSKSRRPRSARPVAALARHWRGAGELERAVHHFVAAAEEAERGWAKDYAVTLYKEALDMTPPEEADRLRFLRRRLAVAQMRCLPRGRCAACSGCGSERELDGGKSAGVTSPAISCRSAISCRPSLVECSRTISSFGARRRNTSPRGLVVDHDVAVLPGDLGELVLRQLARAAADRRHLRLVDVELRTIR
jgi:hypothetical protein